MPNNPPDANLRETERYLAREAAVSSPIIVDGSLTQGRSDHVGHDRRSQIGFLESSLTPQVPRQHETPTGTNTNIAQQGLTSATVQPRLVRPSSSPPDLPIALGGGVQHIQAPQNLQDVDTYQYNFRNLRWPLPADQSKTTITDLMVVPQGSQAENLDRRLRRRGRGRRRGGQASAGGETAQGRVRYPPQSQGQPMNHGPAAQYAVGRVDPGIQWARQGHFGPPGPSFHGPTAPMATVCGSVDVLVRYSETARPSDTSWSSSVGPSERQQPWRQYRFHDRNGDSGTEYSNSWSFANPLCTNRFQPCPTTHPDSGNLQHTHASSSQFCCGKFVRIDQLSHVDHSAG